MIILKENNFWSEIEDGDKIYITTAYKMFGDGWHYPIVEVKTNEKIYLEKSIGIMNQVEKTKKMKNGLLNI
jgi:hypothetical protein